MNDRDTTIEQIYARRQRKRRRRRAFWITILVLLILAALGTGVWLFLRGGDKDAPAPTDPTGETDPSVPAATSATEEPSPTQESTEPPTETPTQPEDNSEARLARAQELLDGMTLEEKLWQMLIVTPEQLTGVDTATRSGDATKAALEEMPVGGLIYFAKNIEDPEQITEMISNAQSYSKLGMFISVDEEGGSVARVASNSAMGVSKQPAQGSITTEADATSASAAIGGYLSKLGFNLNFAPVTDVNTGSEVLGDRAFSGSFEDAAKLVAASVQGYDGTGVLCTLKHFPGMGAASGDPHDGSCVTTRTLDEMLDGEFRPFTSGIKAGADLVMVGHVICTNVTGTSMPASLSKMIVTDILRGTLKFDGLVVTDALNMDAIGNLYDSDSAAVKAVQAGCDLLLMPKTPKLAVQGLADAVEEGKLTEERINESVLRILVKKLEAGIIQ